MASIKLSDMIPALSRGDYQLPDFQRELVWKSWQMEDLLVSILQGFFSGTLLLLQVNPTKPPFALKHFKVVASTGAPTHLHAVLDGQQRMSAVYYTLQHPRVALPGTRSGNPHHFFLDFNHLINSNYEEAVKSFVADRSNSKYKDALDKWYAREAMAFGPISGHSLDTVYTLLMSPPTNSPTVLQNFLSGGKFASDHASILGQLHHLLNYQFEATILPATTSFASVASVFVKINSTGTRLSLFDLAVARLAPSLAPVSLRNLWSKVVKGLKPLDDFAEKKVVEPEFVLKVCSLITFGSIRLRKILDHLDKGVVAKLKSGPISTIAGKSYSTFEDLWNEAAECLNLACERVQKHYGALDASWVPYPPMLVLLAALLHVHRHSKSHRKAAFLDKVDCWYWHSLFYERYDSSVDTTTESDFVDMGDWLGFPTRPKTPAPTKPSKPNFITCAVPPGLDLKTVSSPHSSLYKAVMNLISLAGAKDLITGSSVTPNDYEDDHLFPTAGFGKYSSIDSILNKTLISRTTNRVKGKKNPSSFYASDMKQGHSGSSLSIRHTFETHLVNASAETAFAADDFPTFLAQREGEIKATIQKLLTVCCSKHGAGVEQAGGAGF